MSSGEEKAPSDDALAQQGASPPQPHVLPSAVTVPSEFDWTPEEQRRIIRRVDYRLVVTVGAMYCVSLMDRTNLSAANIAGMNKDLVLTGNRYSIVTLVFFVTYITFQPSTALVRHLGPRLHLASITILWGTCMIGMGFVKTWGQMVALRVLLGALEAGFFSSCVYLLSTWYTRYEVGKRFSMFYLLGCVASAFAGIFAYGLMQMAGLGGLAGWAWIFIIEGVMTCLLGVAGYWLLVDFPDSSRKTWGFLGPQERAWVCARVNADRGDVRVLPFSLRRYFGGAVDANLWAHAVLFFDTACLAYSLAYFLPIILVENMGFSVGAAQCLVAPPYAFAGVIMFGTAWFGDRYRLRGPVIIFNMLLCLVGLPIMGFHSKAGVRYFGVFLTTAGANSNVPAIVAYQANNIRGQWKRAFGSALLIGVSGVGGITGSLVFRSQDAPWYHPGLYTCIGCCILNMVIVCGLSVVYSVLNRQADRGQRKIEAVEAEDEQSDFRYTI